MDTKDVKRIPAQVKVFAVKGDDVDEVAKTIEMKINGFIEKNVSIVLGIEYSIISEVSESIPATGEKAKTLVFSALLTYK